jgi:outer membrane protein assembly factor BamE (lipoprotein component of BamABCDE complex)
MMNLTKVVLIAFIASIAAGCASGSKNAAQTAPRAAKSNPADSVIEGNFPADSAFAKLQIGMTQGQVHEILGQPSDTKSYQTGKAWMPFYFGRDVMRTDEFYKGVGIVTYTGAGIGGVHWKVYRASYDPAEDGVAN